MKRDASALMQKELATELQDAASRKVRQAIDRHPTTTAPERCSLIKRSYQRAPMKMSGKTRRLDDKVIDALSEEQLKLAKKTHRSKGKVNLDKKKRLRHKRRQIFKKLRKRVQTPNKARVKQPASVMEGDVGNRRAFEVARAMTKRQDAAFSLYEKSAGRVYETTGIMKATTERYSRTTTTSILANA